jgi:hypothetical protein
MIDRNELEDQMLKTWRQWGWAMWRTRIPSPSSIGC